MSVRRTLTTILALGLGALMIAGVCAEAHRAPDQA
jgi:hypothetical protein